LSTTSATGRLPRPLCRISHAAPPFAPHSRAGGTSEASELARLLAAHGLCATLSYAGRTENPRAQPIPTRVGGFGGVEGLAAYLRAEGITHLVDATHPFAATMSANACAAAQLAGVPLVALTRPAWEPQEGDRWREVATIAQAVDALAGAPRRVFLALGRQHVEAFAAQPQHRYVLRFVDAPGRRPPCPIMRWWSIAGRSPWRATAR
jgi:precorrin-6A/cobalt-precorrin-6A reductase